MSDRKASSSSLSRRDFLRCCAVCGAGMSVLPAVAHGFFGGKRSLKDVPASQLRIADFWEKAGRGRVRCLTCPNHCVVGEGEVTLCRTRICRDGALYSMTYGRPCVVFEDPLAKNPIYHVSGTAKAIGVGTAGCNLFCKYCQNWSFSQVGPWKTTNMDLSPQALIDKAKSRGLRWITFSYTEPVAYYEYALETARLAQKNGIHVAVVTAGYIDPEPLRMLMKYSDAFSVTLKGYDDAFYREVVGCPLEPVWDCIRMIHSEGKWLEVVNLIVPSVNDDRMGIQKIARAVAKLDPVIPLHFLRFVPAYQMQNLPATPLKTLEQARGIALAQGLKHVYIDNMPGHDASNTYCAACGKLLVERAGFTVINNHIKGNQCGHCYSVVAGVFGN